MSVRVEFLPGDGMSYQIEVAYIAADFARNSRGLCAFCDGDPCAESLGAPECIKTYMAGGAWREHCPFCNGRPS